MFDIADIAFAKVPEEEKKKFTANFKETGLYSGYKLRQYWVRFLQAPKCDVHLSR